MMMTLMNFDLIDDPTQLEFVEAPLYLPRLFVSPSCLPDFTKVLEDQDVACKKAKLLNEALRVAKTTQDQERVEQLHNACASVRLEIECLENEAYVMRTELAKRIYVEVTSEKEMRAVVHLWRGTGAGVTPGMRCFRGKVYVPMKAYKNQWRTQYLFHYKNWNQVRVNARETFSPRLNRPVKL
ncbi:hypothetical protein QVD17_34389 [Tagetes erecta]|uniref:Uncharacterized protein n=1 Tax=Tagetes erecta TaxID=13708 RepID=A0AAD8JZK9_TARER|nr:hypothetical protein QVD17_34389 [Tagetes erecta]